MPMDMTSVELRGKPLLRLLSVEAIFSNASGGASVYVSGW